MAAPRHNGLLAALSEGDLGRLAPYLEPMVLARGQILFEPHEPVSHVHFPAGAVLSLVIPTADGHIAEAATVGREGAIGAVANGTKRTAFSRGVVQVAGPAFRMEHGHGSVKNLGHYAASGSASWPKRPSSTAALT